MDSKVKNLTYQCNTFLSTDANQSFAFHDVHVWNKVLTVNSRGNAFLLFIIPTKLFRHHQIFYESETFFNKVGHI